MLKKIRKLFSGILAASMVMNMMNASVLASEQYSYRGNYLRADDKTVDYEIWLNDANGKKVAFGQEYDINNILSELNSEIGLGEMNASKNGSFESEEDAKNGIVKLTFDVTGKPLTESKPIDVVIIADESGSLNMYGRADVSANKSKPKNSASYMPCLNDEHYYLVDGLQGEINDIAELRGLEVNTASNAYKADDPVFISPHGCGADGVYLAYAVFGHWGNYPELVREMLENADVDVPDGLSDDDLYRALLSDWDTVSVDRSGNLSFTGLIGWTPDKNHYHTAATDSNAMIPYVENNDVVEETDGKYSYWSPETDNRYGCLDRMMVEKEGIAKLIENVYEHDEDSRVAYVGFTYSAYPSLNTYHIAGADSGFCSLDDGDIPEELLDIVTNTNGHDYTNYAHAIWTAKKLIDDREDKSRPVRVIFISDGVPTRTSSATANSWNILEPPVEGGTDGDCIGFNEIYYGETDYSHVTAAEYVANQFCSFLDENVDDYAFYTVGFSTNESADDLLDSMDNNGFYDCADLDEFLDAMGIVFEDMVITEYPDGILTDVIGDDFDLVVNRKYPFTVGKHIYESTEHVIASQKVTIEGKTIKWNLENVKETGTRISFYVQLKDSLIKPIVVEGSTETDYSYETNKNADLSYIPLGKADEQVVTLPTPVLKMNAALKADPTETNPTETNPIETTPQETTSSETTSRVDDEDDERTPASTAPTTEAPTSTPETSLAEIPVPTIVYRGVEIPSSILEEYPGRTLDELFDMGVLGAYFEHLPTGLLPATNDMTIVWTALSVLSAIGLAGVSVISRKREDD